MSPNQGVSIVVPAYREAGNIPTLVQRLFGAMAGCNRPCELIIVDDASDDGTEEAVEALKQYPVRLVVRRHERGLSSAVLAGFREAKYDRFVVMDADLQHPPESVPELIAKLDSSHCDFVIGTRYSKSGEIAKDWPIGRRLASRLATLAARPLARLSDPMSGFFALRRETWANGSSFNPIGYKIALELFVKCRCRNPAEVPIQFATRFAGESKAGLKEGLRFGRHLASLYWFRFPRVILAMLALILIAMLFSVWWLMK